VKQLLCLLGNELNCSLPLFTAQAASNLNLIKRDTSPRSLHQSPTRDDTTTKNRNRNTTIIMKLKSYVSIIFLFLAPRLVQGAPSKPRQASTSSYWLSQIQRQGTIAYASDSPRTVPSDYPIYRDVTKYGALGDGVTDDFEAINRTIFDGGRCGMNCNSTTVQPALVYFPPGTYRISQPIVMPYYTQMVGDATNMPTIKGLPSFQGIALLDSDPYYPGISNPDGTGINWYRNQNNFFRQVRNFNIDLTDMPEINPDQVSGPAGVHWQVAQATSLQNIVFTMKPKSSTNKQQGIYMENGSGGFMSDLTFNGGAIGMAVGNQQFTTRNLRFNGCGTAILIGWDWLWTYKSLHIDNADIGLDMSALQNGNNQTVGSVIMFDGSITNSAIGIKTSRNQTSSPPTAGTLTIQNVDFTGTQNAVVGANGVDVILTGGRTVDLYVQGDVYTTPAGGGSGSGPSKSQQIKRLAQAQAMDPDCEPSSVRPIPADDTPSTASSAGQNAAGPSATNGPGPNVVGPTANSVSASTGGTAPTAAASTAGSPSAAQSSSVPSSSPPSNSNGTYIQSNGTCPAYVASQGSTIQQELNQIPIPQPLLNANGSIFERSKPQYEQEPVSAFVSVKSKGAVGDGVTDDSDAIQQIFNETTADQIVMFDHGAYLITRTIQVPKNIRITGEIWPLIMISGPSFGDVNNPIPAFRVGNPGDHGVVEISDLMFETRGPAPGAIMMEWNVADPNGQQGASGMWDTHFRVGGSAGTELQVDQCRGSTPDSQVFNENCYGAFLMMHITQQATAYFENTWFWVADHELDKIGEDKLNIFNGRGVLIESQGPVWLYGTSSEHHVLYNYQISNARDVFMGFIQTETAYMQSKPNSLTSGFTPNQVYADPTFADCTTDTCKKTWGLRVVDSSDVFVMGGGLYSFFENYDQTCLQTEDCQENMIDIQCSNNVNLFGITTKASVNIINVNGQPAAVGANHKNGFGQTVALYQQA
jgi:glucan 1,3-beta-glucosidase